MEARKRVCAGEVWIHKQCRYLSQWSNKIFRQSSVSSSNFHVLWIPESETKKKIKEQIIILVPAIRTSYGKKKKFNIFRTDNLRIRVSDPDPYPDPDGSALI